MINLKKLRKVLEIHLVDEGYDPSFVRERINIKKKKRMVIEQIKNGNIRAIRKSYLKIEIIV